MVGCKEHCWHETGQSWSYCLGNRGADVMECCHCGERGDRTWEMQPQPIPGHGPHATRKVKVHGAVLVASGVMKVDVVGGSVRVRVPAATSQLIALDVWDAFMNPLPRASTYTSGGA